MKRGIGVLVAVGLAGFAWGCGSGSGSVAGTGGNGSGPGGSSSTLEPTGGSTSASNCPSVAPDFCGLGCVDLKTDMANCGECGNKCSSAQVCSLGACACPGNLSPCGDECVDLQGDNANCGKCAQACPSADQVCSQGQCGLECASTEENCPTGCANTNTSVLNCGDCGNACPSAQTCNAGSCACPNSGQKLCGDACVDTNTNPAHCGDCNKPCSGGATCSSGSCNGGGTGGATSTGGATGAGGSTGVGGGTAGGTNGTGGTSSTTGIPDGIPGVAAVADSSGTVKCVPVCPAGTNPSSVDNTSWGYNNDWAASCIIEGSAVALSNTACTTPNVPDNPSLPGVEVFFKEDNSCVTDCPGEMKCVANCTFYLTPTQDGANSDGLADDWAWERNAQCIIPGTITSHNTACQTGQTPLPKPDPRPGIMVNGDPLKDSCKWSKCVPICRVVTTPSDTEYPDWGWEDNNSCVLPGTDTANWLPEGDELRGCKDGTAASPTPSCYYKWPPRTCTWGADSVDYMKPPALDSAKVTNKDANGVARFRADSTNGTLYDPYDAPFLIRGVNNSHAWYDVCGQYMAYGALANIQASKANTVRAGWAFKTIDPVGPSSGEPEKTIIGTTPGLLAEVLHRIVQLKMVPIITMNDTTGQEVTTGHGSPLDMANMYATLSGGEPSVSFKDVIKAYQPYLLVSIANEWNGTNENFRTAFEPAIAKMRAADGADFHGTLVITANSWGQGCAAVLNDAAYLISKDPDQNLMFDLHLYTYLDYNNCRTGSGDCGSATVVQGCLDDIAAAKIPLVVGEFGVRHSSGAVAWSTIMTRCDANNQGYVPWEWFGDTEYPVLNMNVDWDGPLTDTSNGFPDSANGSKYAWGTMVLPFDGKSNGTVNRGTSTIATIFQ